MLMKDPADRFQSCEELVASIQGQPTAAPGAVRASAAAGGVVRPDGSADRAEPDRRASPLIVSQPTTPIDSPLVNRRATPRERRDVPRRVADRSLAMRGGSGSSWAWLWVVLAVLGGGGGGFYYYKSARLRARRGRGGLGRQPPPARRPSPADSAGAPTPPPAPTGAAPQRSRPAPQPSATAPPRAGPPARRRRAPRQRPTRRRAPTAARGDSGGIRVVGLPRGSTVMIDEKPVTEPVTRLPPGPHALGVSAPRFNFYSDTIVVTAGRDHRAHARSSRRSARPTCRGAESRDAGREPLRARRRATTPTAPASTSAPSRSTRRSCRCRTTSTGTPRPSLLWVKVSAEGRTVDVQRLRPSNDPAFERAVRDFVWTVTWHPALKDGAPVEAWTQMLFPPAAASERRGSIRPPSSPPPPPSWATSRSGGLERLVRRRAPRRHGADRDRRRRRNLQDGTIVHVDEGVPCMVGPRVGVGHRVILHGCTVEDECLIGMGSVLLNGCAIGTGSVVAAGAVIPGGDAGAARSLVMGVPGRIVRQVDAALAARIDGTWTHYVEQARAHRAGPLSAGADAATRTVYASTARSDYLCDVGSRHCTKRVTARDAFLRYCALAGSAYFARPFGDFRCRGFAARTLHSNSQ